jgi:hypothetical protein
VSSFAARFGRVILKHGVAAIPSALYHFQGRLGLSAQQVWFASYILSHKWDEDLPYPSIAQMARCTGISDRMLRYRCNELHHLGYLEIYPRYGDNGGQSTNYYDFARLFARLEEMIGEELPLPNPIRQRQEQGAPASSASPALLGATRIPGAPGLPIEDAQSDTSFLARYGRVILSYGIAAVPRAIFTHQKVLGLTAQQVWFVCYVLSFQWDAALPYPSINKMAERTGYSKQQLHTIKGELVAKGYLEIVRRTADGGGNDTNLYDFSPLFDAIRDQLEPTGSRTAEREAENEGEVLVDGVAGEGSYGATDIAAVAPPRRHRPRQPKHARHAPGAPKSAQGARGIEDAAEVVSQGPAIQLTRWSAIGLTNPSATGLPAPTAIRLTRKAETELPSQGNQVSADPSHHALPTGRKRSLPEVEAIKIEELNQDDSNQGSQENELATKVTRSNNKSNKAYSPYIAAITSDFSRELGDAIHESSNMRQALNLWQNSGLDEEEFVHLMQEARKLTRRYQTRPSWDAMNNKMAYYFATLRDLVGAAETKPND